MSAIAALNALPAEVLRARVAADAAGVIREAAQAGSAEAQARLGQMRLDEGATAEGFAWFARAARAGHVDAINMVGRCYDLGWGVAVDKGAAAAWFRAAAERGHVFGMYNWATALTLGHGVAEDRALALTWFERSAARGNAKALNFIGSFHEDGWAVERDMAKAADHYERAARGGDFRGCFNHARMLLAAGKRRRAEYWIARALELGNDRFRAQVRCWLAAHA